MRSGRWNPRELLRALRIEDRRTAVAAASTGTLFLASTAVALATVLSPPGAHPRFDPERADAGPPTTVVEVHYVEDPPPTGSTGAAAGPGTSGTPATAPAVPPPAPVPAVATPGAATAAATSAAPGAAAGTVVGETPAAEPAGPPATSPVPVPSPAPGSPPTSAPTSTLPPGTEIPSDWPAGVPLPPMPPGCRKPHLEDDGRWNCDH